MLEQSDLKIIEKLTDSYILLHRPSNRRLVYKECQCPIPHQNSHLHTLNIRNTLDHKNLFKLFSFHNENKNGKMALIYEDWDKSFSTEINLRFQTQIHWTEQELLNTLEVLLCGLDCLHSNGLAHGNITKKSIIFSFDGFVRLADQFIEYSGIKKTVTEMISEKNTHLSPETLNNKEGQPFPGKENDIWQLGMIILESCLLRPCLDLIDWGKKTVNFEELNTRILEIEKLKSKNLSRILRIMLNEKAEKRGDVIKMLKNEWPRENVMLERKNKNSENQKILRNSQVVNVSLKANIDKVKENQEKKEVVNENTNSTKSSITIGNKENSPNFIKTLKETGEKTGNLQKPQIKNDKYHEILQMLKNYKSPFQTIENQDNNRGKSQESCQNYQPHDLPNSKESMNRQLINLEGILEENEETIQDDRENNVNEYIKNLQNAKKTDISLPRQNAPANNSKFAELQGLFEKSRARTNEILAKGTQLLSKKVDFTQDGVELQATLISSSIEKIEKKNLLSTVNYTNQDKYEGDLSKNDVREGFGVYYKTNGHILYQGEWQGGVFHGTGILNNLDVKFSQEPLDCNDLNGIKNHWLKYEGEFCQGKKQGNGVLLFSNKEYFQGCFKNDKIHGFGCFHSKNGSLVFAEWKDSKIIRML